MDVFPGIMPETTSSSYEKQTEELCSLFSTALQSLASDAAAVRQLSRIAQNCDKENTNSLRTLDSTLANLEQKVRALRSIVSEEKKAIEKMSTVLQEECQAQSTMIETMMQKASTINNSTTIEPTLSEEPPQVLRSRRDSVDPRKSNNHDQKASSTTNMLEFELVTRQELEKMNRNTRGRISLLDCNEALQEIQQVVELKFDALQQIPSFNSKPRYEYIKQYRTVDSFRESEVKAHDGHFWASEQELRESCVFFRNGESSARALLQLLCSLKRLKQVPGRNRQVTYLCLPPLQE